MSLGDIGCTCNIFFDGVPKKLSNPKKSIKHWVILYRTLKIRFTIFVQSRIHVGVVDRDDLASVEMRAIKFIIYALGKGCLHHKCIRTILVLYVTRSSLASIGKIGLLRLLRQWYTVLTGSTQCLSSSKHYNRVRFKKWIYYGDYFLFRTVSNGHQQDTYPLHRVSSAKHIKS